MDTFTKVAFSCIAILMLPPFFAFGGLYYPNSIAGAIARFVFSLN